MRRLPLLGRLDDGAKLAVKSRVPGWLISRMRPNAIRTAPRQSGRTHGPEIPLYALVCTWAEEDIIHAAIAHAYAQGADRVFLIDNGSPDETVEEAVAAGAVHVMSFTTDSFDEIFKFRLINEQVRQLSQSSGHPKIWWLMMDADEFTSGPGGERLADFLPHVDARCRVVGARVLDHYPLPGVDYVRRSSPFESQPNCREKIDHRCSLGHHKHPLFLWDVARREIVVEPGFHQVACRGEALYEPGESLILDHFPFRKESDMRRRLEMLAARGTTEASRAADADGHMKARLASLDDVYRGRYDRVIDYRTGRPGIEVRPRDDVLGLT